MQSGDPVSSPKAFVEWLETIPLVDPPIAFSRARRAMRKFIDGRIILGGKMGLVDDPHDAYQGVMPGIFEEAITTLEASKPMIPFGAFGGASRDVAIALGLLNSRDRVPRGAQAETYFPALEAVAALKAKLPLRHVDVLRRLAADDRTEALAQTAAGIAQIIDTDEYEVEEVLENWLEFLQKQQISRSKNTLQSLSFQLSRLVK